MSATNSSLKVPVKGASGLPAPTQDLSEGLRNLREHGLTIYPEALGFEELALMREALYREIDWDRRSARHVPHPFDAAESTNVRVWNLVSRDPLFEHLAVHPIALDYVRAVLGWPVRLSTLSGNINYPGSEACMLHADQIWAPEPWPAMPLGLNCGWCLDDFTPGRGSTRVIPGSHRLNRLPQQDDSEVERIAVEVPAGSLLIFESRLWHQTGAFSDAAGSRAAIFAFYQKPLYMPAENWYLQTRPEVLQRASEELLTVLGFRIPSLGQVE